MPNAMYLERLASEILQWNNVQDYYAVRINQEKFSRRRDAPRTRLSYVICWRARAQFPDTSSAVLNVTLALLGKKMFISIQVSHLYVPSFACVACLLYVYTGVGIAAPPQKKTSCTRCHVMIVDCYLFKAAHLSVIKCRASSARSRQKSRIAAS